MCYVRFVLVRFMPCWVSLGWVELRVEGRGARAGQRLKPHSPSLNMLVFLPEGRFRRISVHCHYFSFFVLFTVLTLSVLLKLSQTHFPCQSLVAVFMECVFPPNFRSWCGLLRGRSLTHKREADTDGKLWRLSVGIHPNRMTKYFIEIPIEFAFPLMQKLHS